jgi:NAD(P)-dependent dehydrogenase (short-subunit alcohol dehydrogenase family)
MSRLQGKVAVITGAGGGLGSAIARRLAADGASLILSDLGPDKAGPLAQELGARFVPADVSREPEVAALVEAALEAHGRLDIMVNNAGVIGAVGSIARIEAEHWSRTMAVLLDSVFFGMKHSARAMIAAEREGVILSTTSIAGLAALAPHAYATAKHAVIGLTRSVAAELAPHRIRVNAVAPGYVPTPMSVRGMGGEAQMRAAIASRNPMPSVVEPEEIAGAFAYLAGDDARHVTGQVLTVDAGVMISRLPGGYYDREPEFVAGLATEAD